MTRRPRRHAAHPPGEPRRALLDTSVLIDFPAAQVAQVADEVAMTAVSVGELQFGELQYGVSAATDPLAQLHPRPRRPDLQIAATAARLDV